VRFIAYGDEHLEEGELADLSALPVLRERFRVLWLDVQGLGNAALIESIGALFGLHRLALEDVVNVHQRAKVEVYDGNVFVVLRMPEGRQPLTTEQLALFVGPNFVVTFQEREGDCFDPVRARIRRGGPIRAYGPDYLMYAIIDATVDNWFPVLESYGEALEDLESAILVGPGRDTIQQIHRLRRDLLALRRAVWPLRDALGILYRESTPLVHAETRVYLRDCYDHSVQIIDLLENGRDLAAELTDLYLSMISNRMNEVMKVLTIISTIFLPLSFIAGVYGMNFDTGASRWNMPELLWPLGYPLALGMMLLTALAMLYFFWRRGWLRSDRIEPGEEP
jgi:magnesium transporter